MHKIQQEIQIGNIQIGNDKIGKSDWQNGMALLGHCTCRHTFSPRIFLNDLVCVIVVPWLLNGYGDCKI